MRTTAGPLCAMALAGLLLALGGCAGGGAGGADTLASRLASSQVAAAIYLQQWGQILFGLVSQQTGGEAPAVGDPVFHDDGRITQTFKAADGTETLLTAFPDGSITLETTYPDGRTQFARQSPQVFDGVSRTTTEWEIRTSDGLQVNYTSVLDDKNTVFDSSDDTVTLTGSSVLPDGLRQDFHAVSEAGTGVLHSEQSDGSSFDLVNPLAPPDFGQPDFAQEATGTYALNGSQVEFVVSSSDQIADRWVNMASDFGDGVTGRFTLGPDFSGSGRILEDGSLLALPSWTRTGETEVNYVTAGSAQVAPEGAAQDYLAYRWQTLAALMGPQPAG